MFRDDNRATNQLRLCPSLGQYCLTESAGTKGTDFTTLVASKQRYHVRFHTSPPSKVRLIMGWSSRTINAGTLNDVRVALCYPPGTTLTGLKYNWADITNIANLASPSLSALMTNPVIDTWPNAGQVRALFIILIDSHPTPPFFQGMYFVDCDAARCWIYIRMLPRTVRDPSNLNSSDPNLWAFLDVNSPRQGLLFSFLFFFECLNRVFKM